jgi:DNA polymerase
VIECRADFETRSDVDLRTRGQGPYFASPHFRPLGLTLIFDDGEMVDWEWGEPCPPRFRTHVEAGGLIRAWNYSFERQCFDWLAGHCGWPRPTIEQGRCSAAEASAMGLPRSLDAAGAALGVTIRKDKRGEALIRKFSIPVRSKDGVVRFNEPAEHPIEYAEFIEYRRQDVRAEGAIAERLVPLSDYEWKVYALDQRINDRGLRIDRTSAVSALRLAEKTKALLDAEMRDVTNGAVKRCTEVAKLVEWVEAQGIAMESAGKADILDLLALDDLPEQVRAALELRRQAAKTSVSKLAAMLSRANEDGRVRHSFIYHKASTGRWQSTGVNFANLPRPRRVFEEAHLDPAALHQAIRTEDPQWLATLYGPVLGRPLDLLSDAIRGFILAAPGRELVQADFVGIEGAVIAWSSGEDWKVQALHEIMADPSLPDMYRRAAALIMGMTTDVITKKHPLRQSVGKTSELALAFGGAVAAFYAMARNYGIDLDMLFEPVWKIATEERREKAIKRYDVQLKLGKSATTEMSRNAWLACMLVTWGWRDTNPATAAGWRKREEAIRSAIREPGVVTHALKFSYVVRNGYLWARLPSGRCLAYASPKLRDQVWAKLRVNGELLDAEVMDREQAEKLALRGEAEVQGNTSPAITALGLDKSGKVMKRERPHGGVFAENDTQAIARDLLVNGMFEAEDAGYPIIGHVYDEMFAELPVGMADLKSFEKLICKLPPWAVGLPLQAGGYIAKRFKKD